MAFYSGEASSLPGQSMFDLWWAYRHWEIFPPEFFCFPRQFLLHQCSIFTLHPILHPREDHWEVRGYSSTKTGSPRPKIMKLYLDLNKHCTSHVCW